VSRPELVSRKAGKPRNPPGFRRFALLAPEDFAVRQPAHTRLIHLEFAMKRDRSGSIDLNGPVLLPLVSKQLDINCFHSDAPFFIDALR
jgi:hypothetical protein